MQNSYPQINLEVWNGLEKDVVHANTISEFKVKLDKGGYEDGIICASRL